MAGHSSEQDVHQFIASFEHPFRDEVLALREIILHADPAIAEGIKWNSLSFRTSEYFATFHLRGKNGVQIILHRGSKKGSPRDVRTEINDPCSMLEWLGEERGSVRFADLKAIEKRSVAFAELIREWIRTLSPVPIGGSQKRPQE
jgi:hypothetical protein